MGTLYLTLAFAGWLSLTALLVLIWRQRSSTASPEPLLRELETRFSQSLLTQLNESVERTQRALREEIATTRSESDRQSRALREEVAQQQRTLGELHIKQIHDTQHQHKLQLDGFATALTLFREQTQRSLETSRQTMDARLDAVSKLTEGRLEANRLTSEQKLEQLRLTVEQRLLALQEDNAKKLEIMRQTVDEKLQGTLEKRLGESFKLVSERLEQVHKGLGEMQTLAVGVGDLKKVMTNVKTRGTFGEVQLQALIEQFFAPAQYEKNVATVPGSSERVEFALRFPNREDTTGQPILMPIDSKFPMEDYQRLVDASNAGDSIAMEQAGVQLEQAVKKAAKDISEKYLSPPHTTEFGIMFIPSEALWAELVRRDSLMDMTRRELRIVIAGPTTLAALLSSFQMGFRTLAIQKRSQEVWSLLGVVKTEFSKYGQLLEKVKKQLDTASNTIDDAARKTRTIEKKLKGVQQLPTPGDDQKLLDFSDDDAEKN